MEEIIWIQGIKGGHLDVPSEGAPRAVLTSPSGTVRLAAGSSNEGQSLLPITLRVDGPASKISMEDSVGRLMLSWSSSEAFAARAPDSNGSSLTVLSPSMSHATSPKGIAAQEMDDAINLPQRSVPEVVLKPAIQSSPSPPGLSTTRGAYPPATQPDPLTNWQRTWIARQLWKLIDTEELDFFSMTVDISTYKGYRGAVQQPLDFLTIYCKLLITSEDTYPTLEAVMADFKQVIEHVVKYNGKWNWTSRKAKGIGLRFEECLRRLPALQGDELPVVPEIREVSTTYTGDSSLCSCGNSGQRESVPMDEAFRGRRASI